MESGSSAGNSFGSTIISWALPMSTFFYFLSFLFCFCLLESCLYDSSSLVWSLSSRFCLTVFVEQGAVNKRRGKFWASPSFSSSELSLLQSVSASAFSIGGNITISSSYHYLHLKSLRYKINHCTKNIIFLVHLQNNVQLTLWGKSKHNKPQQND